MNEKLYNTISLHLESYRKQRIDFLKKCKNKEDYYSDDLFNLNKIIDALESIMSEYLNLDEYITQLEAQISRDRESLIKEGEND